MTLAQSWRNTDDVIHALASVGYEADRRLATAVFLTTRLQRPS